MKRITWITILLLASPATYAASNSGIYKCKKIESPLERLACYDRITSTSGNEDKGSAGNKHTNWSVSTSASPVDDSKTVTLTTRADKPFTAMMGSAHPILLVRCKQNKTEMFISWDTYINIQSTPVLTRLDKGKATTASWGVSTDNSATFAPRPISLIKSMFGKNTLLAQVTPYGQSPASVSFDVRGLKDAIKPLRQACHW